MSIRSSGWAALLTAALAVNSAAAPGSLFPAETRRVLVLGDSITYSGQYAVFLEAYLRVQHPRSNTEILNLGLPSETVSGLTEPGHAGGRFPRPDLHERLDRILSRIKPDLVLACYGMNDGIYHPYSEERFRAFQDGIRRLRDKVQTAGADLIHLTPPVFDPAPILERTLPAGRDAYTQPYVGYNEVLDLYSAWLLAQRGRGWRVIDAHGPMNRVLMETRHRDPSFRFAGDGVHINEAGHWMMTRQILLFLDAPGAIDDWSTPLELFANRTSGEEVLRLIGRKQRLLSDAWLNEIGHLRPGMAEGKSPTEAEAQARELDREMEELLKP